MEMILLRLTEQSGLRFQDVFTPPHTRRPAVGPVPGGLEPSRIIRSSAQEQLFGEISLSLAVAAAYHYRTGTGRKMMSRRIRSIPRGMDCARYPIALVDTFSSSCTSTARSSTSIFL